MHLKPFDYAAIIASVLVVAGSVILTAPSFDGRELFVRIEYADTSFLYSLQEQAVVLPDGEPGLCRIRIEDGAAWVEESDCPQNICIRMGRIRRPGDWIACLPHNLVMTVEGDPSENVYDAWSY